MFYVLSFLMRRVEKGETFDDEKSHRHRDASEINQRRDSKLRPQLRMIRDQVPEYALR